MKGGYLGKMLFVDLTEGVIKEQELSEKLARDFIGGYGIGARVLFEMMKPGADPLGPDNVLGFVTGPLTATGVQMGGRYTVVCKSPVTGGWNDANSGGFFGPELKKAGYDAVFFTGAAKKPVYLWIKNGKAELRDAGGLWGKDAKETEAALKEELGEPKLRAAVIGPAGEKLSLISCPINDGHRAPARGGAGAVMGSKKLKAIVVRGTGQVPVADKARVAELNGKVHAILNNPPEGPYGAYLSGFQTLGTGATTTHSALRGDSPVKNWGGVGIVDFGEESANKVGAHSFDAKYNVRKYACANCSLGCGAVYKVEDGKWPLEETERPEYETMAAFGSNCLNDDIASIFKCNEICNRYGLDTISAGATVSWVLECYEKGILTKKELDGIDATWGNADAIVALTQKIADQEGCGKVLALGSAGAARKWGKGEEYLQTASGIEVGMHDPRAALGWARTYQYDPTPGRHVKGGSGTIPPDVPGRAQIDLGANATIEVMNSTGICLFTMFSYPEGGMAQFVEAVTGWTFTQQDVYTTGLRILNMRHAFNLREGLKRSDFTISPRAVGKPPLTQGPTAGQTSDNEGFADAFFGVAGWDPQTLKPSAAGLEALGGMEIVISALQGE